MREEKEGGLLRTNSTACVLHLRDTAEEEEASLGGKRTSPAKFKPAMQLSWDISPGACGDICTCCGSDACIVWRCIVLEAVFVVVFCVCGCDCVCGSL